METSIDVSCSCCARTRIWWCSSPLSIILPHSSSSPSPSSSESNKRFPSFVIILLCLHLCHLPIVSDHSSSFVSVLVIVRIKREVSVVRCHHLSSSSLLSLYHKSREPRKRRPRNTIISDHSLMVSAVFLVMDAAYCLHREEGWSTYKPP
ncbi:hypothetical protein Q3G72_029996 [Acer saccharum]|nr:hypothetical protein Q3G72_029996 [Acer saccharum]